MLAVFGAAQGRAVSIQAVSYPAEYEYESRFYLLAGELNPLCFYFWGDKKAVARPVLVIDAPEGVNIAYAFHPGYWTHPAIETLVRKSAGSGGGNRFEIPLNEELVKKGLLAKQGPFDPAYLAVLFDTGSKSSGGGALKWHLEDATGNGDEKTVECEILPPIEALSQPFFSHYFYRAHLLKAPDAAVRKRLGSLYRKAGVEGFVDNGRSLTQDAMAEKMKVYAEASLGGWGGAWWGVKTEKACKDRQLKPGDILIVMKDGRQSKAKNAICQSWLIDQAEYVIGEMQKGILKPYYFENLTTGFLNDYELDIFSDIAWKQSCFCARCKETFVRRCKMNIQPQGLSPGDLLGKYRKEWLDFRYWQNGEMMRLYARAVRGLDPKLKVAICSVGVPFDREKTYHPIDPAEYDDCVDEHWPMFYTQSPNYYREMDHAVKHLKKPVIPCVNTCFPLGEHNAWPPELLFLNIMATASTGGRGACYFVGDSSMDARYYHAIGDANKLLKVAGRFYQNGQRCDEQAVVRPLLVKEFGKGESKRGFPDLREFVFHNVRRLDGEWLITLFNYNVENAAFVELSFPKLAGGAYEMADAAGGRVFVKTDAQAWDGGDLNKGVLYKIPPRGVCCLVVKPGGAKASAGTAQARDTENSFREEFCRLQRTETKDDPQGLIGSWSFEKSDEKIVVLKGAKEADGLAGKGLAFDGKKAYAELVVEGLADRLRDAFSLELWVYPESLKQCMCFIGKKGSLSMDWFQPTQVLPCGIRHLGQRRWMDAKLVPAVNRWNHLVFTYGGGYLRLHHDGNEVDAYYVGKLSIDRSDAPLTLSSAGAPFHGRIDEVRIYDRRLKGEEVWQHYIKSAPQF
ncbi:MAG: LamG domain-containing protein [Verrucomicrobiae bacterium]|nr:LamG domain-containing protein [Verrucomicrobiae bacterium]